jgi:hypothetical protein
MSLAAAVPNRRSFAAAVRRAPATIATALCLLLLALGATFSADAMSTESTGAEVNVEGVESAGAEASTTRSRLLARLRLRRGTAVARRRRRRWTRPRSQPAAGSLVAAVRCTPHRGPPLQHG